MSTSKPYYTKAEYLYSVHGERGTDPTEPPASSNYPFPPLPHSPRVQELAQGLRDAGFRPFPLPVGVMFDGRNPDTSRCPLCDTCDGYPCPLRGKADAHVVCIQRAIQYENVALLPRSNVTRLKTSPSGREVTEVRFDRDGKPEIVSAGIVVVSCGAINSAALLLRSANDKHPHGLANRSGVVGRFYMGHIGTAMLVVSRVPNPTVFQKTLAFHDFYFGVEDWPYPMGQVQMLGKSNAGILQAEAPSFVRRSPSALTRPLLKGIAAHALDFSATSEDLPDPDNRVSLDSRGNIVLDYKVNNLEGHLRLVARFKDALNRLPALSPLLHLTKRFPSAGTAHQCGTIRFGRDSAASAWTSTVRLMMSTTFMLSMGASSPPARRSIRH